MLWVQDETGTTTGPVVDPTARSAAPKPGGAGKVCALHILALALQMVPCGLLCGRCISAHACS